jgi:hypothetical protein
VVYADGIFDWEVPFQDSPQCLVRVTSEGGGVADESDGVFTIVPPGIGRPNLKAISISPTSSLPNVGDSIDIDVTVRDIGNAPAGLFYTDLFYNRSTAPTVGETGDQSKPVEFLAAGSEVNVIFTGVSSSVTGIWYVYAVIDTHTYVIESNESDNTYGPTEIGWGTPVDTLRITEPNGFEALEQGKTFVVTWTWTGNPGALVNVELSTNGGATWSEVVSGTLNDGSYEWTVTAEVSPDCRLRISNFTGSVVDISDDIFEIMPAGASALGYFGEGCAIVSTAAEAPSRPFACLLAFAVLLGAACRSSSTTA